MAKDERTSRSKKTATKNGPKRLVIYLPQPLAKQFRVSCAERERTLSDAGVEAIEHWIGKSWP